MNHHEETRFWEKVIKGPTENACWIWTAAIGDDGYGRFWTQTEDGTQNEPEDEWTAVLQISDPEEPESFVDLSAFFDKLKGVSDCASFVVSDEKPADEPEPFIECENKLLERFNLTREDLEDIYISRSR